MLELRPYQRESVDALYAYWSAGGGNPLVVLPTGAGKSLVIATIVKELLAKWPDMRIGMVTHSRELIAQNFQELIRLWPGAPSGIYSAGLGRRDARSRIVFMGVQSVWRKAREVGPFDLLLIDEAHLISRDAGTMYGKFITALRDQTEDMRLVGLTATPYRLDSGRLHEGDGVLFDAIAYEISVRDLIDQGYLSPLVSKQGKETIDTSKLHRLGGEFVPREVDAAAMENLEANVQEIIAYGQERRAWLTFSAGVEHATAVRDELRRYGVSAEVVTGDMDKGARDQAIRRFKSGDLRCLTSVGVLTTGFNVPHVDLIALMYSTLSAGKYVQTVGRGFRLAEGKANCLVLDYGNNVRRHGPVDLVEIKPPGEGGGDAPVKECPQCASLIYASYRTCPDCGHEFPPPEPEEKLQREADTTPILSKAPALALIEEVPVVGWECRKHEKLGSPDSLCVSYYAGLMSYREWWAFEHAGFARAKAEKLWRLHGGEDPAPADVFEAQSRWGELTPPASIQVRKNGKFFDIMGRKFARAAQGEAA